MTLAGTSPTSLSAFCTAIGQARRFVSLLAAVCVGVICPAASRADIALSWPPPPDEPRIAYEGIVRIEDTAAASPEKPYGVAAGPDGTLYVTSATRVLLYDKTLKRVGSLGGRPGTGRLQQPTGIAVRADGKVYVSDSAAAAVLLYDRGGSLTGQVGTSGDFGTPAGIALDEVRKRLYVVDTGKHAVRVYSLPDHKHLQTIGSRGIGGAGRFNFPTNCAADAEGKLYVADTGNFRVQVFGREGNHLRSIGGPGDAPGSFARPKGIGIDSEGHLYVADAAFQNIQVFDAEGRLLLFFGAGGWGPGFFTLPAGVHVASDDRILVVDQWPGTVQIFRYLGDKAAAFQGKGRP